MGVCMNLSTTSSNNKNFCEVTGHPDWCSSATMPCHNDTKSYCQIQNWCVCEWAFASYIQKSGGCDNIQHIVCESINEQTIEAYSKQRVVKKYSDALDCIMRRCGLYDVSDNTNGLYVM